MATLLPNGKQTFLDANGDPLVNGTVTNYVPGTTTLKDTWQDAAGTILNLNPVILDAAGEAVIYGNGVYRQVLKDQFGNVVWDQTTADTSASATSWAGTSSGSANAQTLAAPNFSSQNGQTIDFIAGFTNTGAFSVQPNGGPAIGVKKDAVSGPAVMVGGEVTAGNVYRLTYDATAGLFHLTHLFDKAYVDAQDSAVQTNAYNFAQTAQANAIAAAATDATTKANAAQAAAISTSETFATNGDSTVQTNAFNFAQTAQNNAVGIAATDATNKANAAQSAAQTFATNADTTATTANHTYADTQASNAQANAIADALSKYVSGVRSTTQQTATAGGTDHHPGSFMISFSGATIYEKYLQIRINGTWATIGELA